MGAPNRRDMSRFHVLLVATLLAFAVSELAPETELEEAYSPEEAHADAQQSIDALLQEGKKAPRAATWLLEPRRRSPTASATLSAWSTAWTLARTAIQLVWQHTTPPRAARPALATSTTPPTTHATAPRSRNSRWAALLSSTT